MKETVVSKAAEILAGKIFDGIHFFSQTKIAALAPLIPEIAGIALVVCGIMAMVGNTQKWLARAGIVTGAGVVLVILL
ncbi:hypothetical protein [Neobacillus mesonae]|uniref:hypothetical protein n=1 Tax=Neobacillus mesonae TaxID=1193713 RepID=UPI00203BBB54|nr:hypothetical protein [Neobacillus mesonae]MCM3569842.1 hypothetical protein [Neobacillus mesonae]